MTASAQDTATDAAATVVLNEVLYDPLGEDLGAEIIEVANLGTTAQNLSGWSLCVNGVGTRAYYIFPDGLTLAAGAFLRVHWVANGTNTATDLFTGTTNFPCFHAPILMNNTVVAVSL